MLLKSENTMLKNENEQYKKLLLLNTSKQNILEIRQAQGYLTVMTVEATHYATMEIDSLNYCIYKVFENTLDFNVSNRIATASIFKGKNYSALLDAVAVIENEQGNGYGTCIIERIIADSKSLKLSRLFGHIYQKDIDTPDKLARFTHFYKKLGFQIDFDEMKLFRNIL